MALVFPRHFSSSRKFCRMPVSSKCVELPCTDDEQRTLLMLLELTSMIPVS